MTSEIAIPDISELEIEDNFQSDKQQRLLVEPIYSSRELPVPFIAANVGIFYSPKQNPVGQSRVR
ncbi:MAG: hypothetical protein PUP93_28150 [Rhizonema sp. NSF051]|nr:hypothetical protein [Rhizonema sp. NSF051]